MPPDVLVNAEPLCSRPYVSFHEIVRPVGLFAPQERDVIRLRTNFRNDEEVFLYRASMGPEPARAIFLTTPTISTS